MLLGERREKLSDVQINRPARLFAQVQLNAGLAILLRDDVVVPVQEAIFALAGVLKRSRT